MTTYQVTQETANKLLYQAWDNYQQSEFWFEMDPDDYNQWKSYERTANAYLKAWEAITDVELVGGVHALRKFEREDFREVIEAEQREIMQEQLDEFEACGVAFLL